MNLEILKDKSLYPQTAPGQDGKTRKISIAPNTFGDDCETIEFKYVAGKGEFLTFNADIKTYEMIMRELEMSLRKREPIETTFAQSFKNKPSSYLTVGRKEDGLPFIRIKATTKQGQERNKEFFFQMPRNIDILRNGVPINDLEKAERSCFAFLKNQAEIFNALKAQYKAREWNNQGGGYGGGNGGGGYNKGGNGGGYNNNNNNGNNGGGGQREPQVASTDNFDDMF